MTSPLSAVGAATPTTTTSPTTSTTPTTDSSQLSSQAFLKLIVAQLQYQDPTQPADTTAFMNQTATLNQIEATAQMTQAMNLLLRNSLSQEATALVGRTVTYQDSSGNPQTGLVTGARLDGVTPSLRVGDVDVPLAAVTDVTSAPAS